MKMQDSRHELETPPESEGSSPGDTAQLVEPSLSTKRELTTNLIGWILQGGVILSAAVILAGVLLESLKPDKFAPQKLQLFPQTLGQAWTGLLILRPQAVIALGLLLLIATPVVRVVVSIAAFAVASDRRFVVITLLVLLLPLPWAF